MLICKSQTIKYILLTAALYGPCVLANRGSGKQQLDTYDDTTTSISSSSSSSLAPESLQSMSMPHSSSLDEALAEESAHADSVNERIGITIPDDNKNNTVEEDEKHRHHQQKQHHEEEQEAPMEEMQEPTQPEDQTQGDIIENSNVDLDPADDPSFPTRVQADANNNNPSAALPPVPQITGCRTQGQIAVTYSEGPSDATASIVRQLTHADARANFFVNASWLYTQQYAMVVQNTYKKGHLIGMTYRVKNDDSSKLTDEELKHDILEKAHIIETLIHVAPKYVRLHYTEPEDTRTEHMLQKLGFVLVGYNLDSQDYAHKPVEEVYSSAFRRYKETYDAKGSFISVQYDMPGTIKASTVPHMINTINDEGYTMVRLDGCLNDPKPYKKSAESLEYVSDEFSFNTKGYHQGQNPVAQHVIEEAESEDREREKTGYDNNEPESKAAIVSNGTWMSALFMALMAFIHPLV
ncbi:hypothetical protein RO3G_06829 [Lichtheimia corymbifera JMRC:FSU:9682]|uniref:NodB homology domain-containing protein n=1 Tax=Lichtheimia corymbifera JMRC:FSU:9682 TaxID=1263082 RepID=A0A068RKV3_9FUNG|nr:hypothetical protein RO3G_06829 [Lichtheimia corymbifera JMRC:FSU:9682]